MRRLLLVAALAALVAGCGASGAYTPATTTSPAPSSSRPPLTAVIPPSSTPAQTPPPRQAADPGHVTGTLTGPCHYRGAPVPNELPDPGCTPGAYDPAVTAAVLCAAGYTTRSYRPPASETTKFKYGQAYPAYGIPASETSELDHLISLELGGSNDAANLWPEPPGVPNPKDSVENQLHRWVCHATGAAAQTRLQEAQAAIAADWTTAEQVLGIGQAAIPGTSSSPA
jgi:hypothetical protein